MLRLTNAFHICSAALVLALAGCGQTGKLYLRPPPGELQKPVRLTPSPPVLLPSGSTYPVPAAATAHPAPAPAAVTHAPPRP